MAANRPFGFVPVRDDYSSQVATNMLIATGQSIKCGDPVFVDGATGLVTLGTTTTTRFCGVALETVASAVAGSTIAVARDPEGVFRIQTTGAVFGAAMLGKTYDISGATGVFKLNLAAQTINSVKVVGIESTGTYGIALVVLNRHQFLNSEGLNTDTITLLNGNIIANPGAGTVTVDADLQPLTLTSAGLVQGADVTATDDLTVGDAIVAAKYALPYANTAAQTGTFNLAALPSGIVPINNAAAVVIQFASAVKGIWFVGIQKAVDGGNTVKFDVDSSGGDLSYAGGGDITLSGATDIGKVVTVVGDGTKYFIRGL